MTPYQEAYDWIRRHPNAPEALGLAKLILSLHHAAYAFSFRECTDGMEDGLMALALRVIGQFVRVGREDDAMLEIASALAERYPMLTQLAEQLEAANRAFDAQLQADPAAGD
ncbi:MAG TPA: hypothetical protein PLS95_16955 [Thermoanaerobaculales bacterium]|nr:hypothetical protein [Thermoanaerobaculales bacterium]